MESKAPAWSAPKNGLDGHEVLEEVEDAIEGDNDLGHAFMADMSHKFASLPARRRGAKRNGCHAQTSNRRSNARSGACPGYRARSLPTAFTSGKRVARNFRGFMLHSPMLAALASRNRPPPWNFGRERAASRDRLACRSCVINPAICCR
jgi:hypothetical protein